MALEGERAIETRYDKSTGELILRRSDGSIIQALAIGDPAPDEPEGLTMVYEHEVQNPFEVPLSDGHIRGHVPTDPGGANGNLYLDSDDGGPVDDLISGLTGTGTLRLTDASNSANSIDYAFDIAVNQPSKISGHWQMYCTAKTPEGAGLSTGASVTVELVGAPS